MLWRMSADFRRERIGMMYIAVSAARVAACSLPAATRLTAARLNSAVTVNSRFISSSPEKLSGFYLSHFGGALHTPMPNDGRKGRKGRKPPSAGPARSALYAVCGPLTRTKEFPVAADLP